MIVGIEKLSTIFIMLIFTGILMVMISTYTSVNKYLNSTLDDLYKQTMDKNSNMPFKNSNYKLMGIGVAIIFIGSDRERPILESP